MGTVDGVGSGRISERRARFSALDLGPAATLTLQPPGTAHSPRVSICLTEFFFIYRKKNQLSLLKPLMAEGNDLSLAPASALGQVIPGGRAVGRASLFGQVSDHIPSLIFHHKSVLLAF